MQPVRVVNNCPFDLSVQSFATLSGNPAFEPPRLLRDLVDQGHLGQKTGKGFYDW